MRAAIGAVVISVIVLAICIYEPAVDADRIYAVGIVVILAGHAAVLLRAAFSQES